MRLAFAEEQEAFAAAVRDALAKECPPSVVRAAWEGKGWPDGPVQQAWDALVAMGVFELDSALDWARVLEEVGRAAVPAPVAETVAVAPLLGEGRGRVAAGSGGGPVAWAEGADVLVLLAGDEVHAVPAAGARLTPLPAVDRARPVATVEWDPSPATRLDGVDAAVLRDRGALAAACTLAGLAAHLLDTTVEYARQRQQFGRPIGSFQAVKHHLADAAVKIEFARPVVHAAAWAAATGQPDASLRASMAKAFASDAATFAARVALQVHGAIGYSYEHDLHRWIKRAWALAADWGDAASHRRRVAAEVLGPGRARRSQ